MTEKIGGARGAGIAPATDGTVTLTHDDLLAYWAEAYVAGYDRGYESRVDEENATYPPPKVLSFGRWYDQALEREKWYEQVLREVAEAGA